jgi:hypothetical protein
MIELAADKKDITDENLIREFNIVLAGLSCLLILYSIWTLQRVMLRRKYDKMRDDESWWGTLFMAICCYKCSDAQMAVNLEYDQIGFKDLEEIV